MRYDDRLDDRKSQTDSTCAPGTRKIGSIKAVEDVGQSLRQNPNSVIGDL